MNPKVDDSRIGAIANARRALDNAKRWNQDPPIILQCADAEALVKAAEELPYIIDHYEQRTLMLKQEIKDLEQQNSKLRKKTKKTD